MAGRLEQFGLGRPGQVVSGEYRGPGIRKQIGPGTISQQYRVFFVDFDDEPKNIHIRYILPERPALSDFFDKLNPGTRVVVSRAEDESQGGFRHPKYICMVIE